MIKEKLLKWIKDNYDEEEEILCILWSKEDVALREIEIRMTLFPDERKEVLKRIKKGYNANYGITWETLDTYIKEVFEHRKK